MNIDAARTPVPLPDSGAQGLLALMTRERWIEVARIVVTTTPTLVAEVIACTSWRGEGLGKETDRHRDQHDREAHLDVT